MLDRLIAAFEPWATLYSDSATLPTAILALHLLAILAGGGIAIAADRQLLRVTARDRASILATAKELRNTHGIVIGSLGVIVASGLALATADLGTFASSRVFWTKMAVIAGLLVNGTLMRRAEARVLVVVRDTGELPDGTPQPTLTIAAPWAALRRSAWISLVGWFTVMLLGVLVSNV